MLVDAGVIDSLLSALRVTVDYGSQTSPLVFGHVQVDLAMALSSIAVSSLGDIGGNKVRKKILSSGGLTILKRLASVCVAGTEVEKACNTALKSVSGNVVMRNAGMCSISRSQSIPNCQFLY